MDVQASSPAIRVSLSRVGVTNVEKVTRIGQQLYYVKLDCFVDLGAGQRGAHMSRFEEVVNDAIGEVVLGQGGFKAEELARRIAVNVRERQHAVRAEVTRVRGVDSVRLGTVCDFLVEQRPRAQSRGEAIATEQGEILIFATRHRPVEGARGFYRAAMRHGVSRLLGGSRYTLGVIFHDAR